MPWFLRNSGLLDTMADLAGDPDKLASFKADPERYLAATDLSEDDKNAILSHDHKTMLRALMSKVDDQAS